MFVRRVRPQGRADHRPAGRQGSPRPPDMQGRDVTVADRFLPPRMRGNPLDRQIDFYETFGVVVRHSSARQLFQLGHPGIEPRAGGPNRRETDFHRQ